MESVRIDIHTPDIRLDGALKFGGLVGTGGEAKFLIQSGQVRVNDAVETRRSHTVRPGDQVEVCDEEGRVQVRLEIVARVP